jgi:hypothetical protein
VGLLVLQRWVAETKTAAIVLVGIWFVVVGVATLVAVSGRPELRTAALGTYAAIALASAVVGYWTGFRDDKVDEDVVMATMAARGEARDDDANVAEYDTVVLYCTPFTVRIAVAPLA